MVKNCCYLDIKDGIVYEFKSRQEAIDSGHGNATGYASVEKAEDVKKKAREVTGYTGGSIAFTDGSYKETTDGEGNKIRKGGYAVVLYAGESFDLDNLNKSSDSEPTYICGGKAPYEYSCDGEVKNGCQVPGELLAVEVACEEALRRGLSKLTIVFDCNQAFNYYVGLHRTIKPAAFVDYLESIEGKLDLHFVWQKSHTDEDEEVPDTFSVRGNDYADKLAGYYTGKTKPEEIENGAYGWLKEEGEECDYSELKDHSDFY